MLHYLNNLWAENQHIAMLIVGIGILVLCLIFADRTKHVKATPVIIRYRGKMFKPWQFFIASMSRNLLQPPSIHRKSSVRNANGPHARNKNEEQCREILQRLTGKKFNSVRPDFLKNPETNRNLELDMYCEEMNVAFEYNGCQHYHFIPGGFFHPRGEIDFKNQQKRDRFKEIKCKEAGIKLFVVPYTIKGVEAKEEFIRKCLRSL